MQAFIEKHKELITSPLGCFDRVIFKGYLPVARPDAMEQLLQAKGVLIKDLKPFVLEQSERIREHAEALASRAGRPFIYQEGALRKEDFARETAQKDGIVEGLVCAFPMAKGVANLRHYATHARRTCEHYLAALAAVMRGEGALHGFRHSDVARQLGLASGPDPAENRRRSAKVSRLIHLLRAHGLVAKVPRTRRYNRVTAHGASIMGSAIRIRHELPKLLQLQAS